MPSKSAIVPNLPQSAESERALLGAILLDNSVHEQAAALVRAGDFFLPSNQTLFLRMGIMRDAGKPIDLVTITEELARHNELDQIGGAAYVSSMTDGLPRLANIEHYARIVKEKALLRAAIYHGSEIVAKAQNGIEHAGRFLQWARDEMPQAPEGDRKVGSILEDVEEKAVAWLWPNRIPLGAITIVDGDPGCGKSLLLTSVAARVSRGYPLPGSKDFSEAAGVVICSAEDSLEHVIRGRFRAANADLSRVLALPYSPELDQDVTFCRIPDDIPVLRSAIDRISARLVIVDVLMAYLPGELNSNRDQDVRRALAPLAALAEQTQCAIVLIRHLNKNSGLSALHRGGGSIGIVGAARSGLLLARDPSADDLRVLAVVKSNFGAPAESISFRIKTANDGMPVIEWAGASEHSAETLLAVVGSDERSSVDEAGEFLSEELADGSCEAVKLIAKARQLGFAERTLNRAKKNIGVKSTPTAGKWYWTLPGKVAK